MKTKTISLSKIKDTVCDYSEIIDIKYRYFLFCFNKNQQKINEHFPENAIKYFTYLKEHAFSTLNRNIYKLNFNKDGERWVSLNFWQNQRFLWLQKEHWLQKEENLRYIVNIVFLIIGTILSCLNILK